MIHCFVINPAAGKKLDTNNLTEKIEEAAKSENITPIIYKTTACGDAIRYVSEQCRLYNNETIRFYACGGDGTLNEVVNAAVKYNNAEVAVVPLGTGNDYVKLFSNPEFFTDFKRQIHGTARKTDLLKFNNKYCINILNIGFDCAVVQKVSEIKTKPWVPSNLAYIMGVISTFCKKFGSHYKIDLDNEHFDEEFTLSVFGKGSYYGDGFKSLPLSKPDDGYIDVCIVKKVSRLTFIKVIGTYKKGLHAENLEKFPFMEYRKCKKIHFESDEPVGICADGEITLEKTIDIEVAPNALAISIPQGCEFSSISENKSNEKNHFEYQEV